MDVPLCGGRRRTEQRLCQVQLIELGAERGRVGYWVADGPRRPALFQRAQDPLGVAAQRPFQAGSGQYQAYRVGAVRTRQRQCVDGDTSPISTHHHRSVRCPVDGDGQAGVQIKARFAARFVQFVQFVQTGTTRLAAQQRDQAGGVAEIVFFELDVVR